MEPIFSHDALAQDCATHHPSLCKRSFSKKTGIIFSPLLWLTCNLQPCVGTARTVCVLCMCCTGILLHLSAVSKAGVMTGTWPNNGEIVRIAGNTQGTRQSQSQGAAQSVKAV